MKVIRCKDCILDNSPECPLAYIENHTMCFYEHSPTFYCAKGRTTEDYTPTHGDIVRNMTDRQLAEMQNRHEHTGYAHGKGGGVMKFGKTNIDFLTGWYGAPDGEDYEPEDTDDENSYGYLREETKNG